MNFIPPSFSFKGNRQNAISLKGHALAFFNHVSKEAERVGVPFISRTKVLADGSVITITSTKQSNYSNRVGNILISSPPSSILPTINKGNSVYITTSQNMSSKPRSAIFSYTAKDPLTGLPKDTTSIFKNRFNYPYTIIVGSINNAVEWLDDTQGIPGVSKICNSIKYDSKGQPIVYSGLKNYAVFTGFKDLSITNEYGPALLSYQNIKYISPNTTDNIIFDIFLDQNIIYVLAGNNINGGSVHLYAIDSNQGSVSYENRFIDVGYEICNLSAYSSKYTLNYLADGGAQANDYSNISPYYSSRIIDAKFSPEFKATGEITILGRTKNKLATDACVVYEFTFNITQDKDRGLKEVNYLFPINVNVVPNSFEVSYNWMEAKCTSFDKHTDNITCNTKVYFGPNNPDYAGSASRYLTQISGIATTAAPQAFATHDTYWGFTDDLRDPYYYKDNVTSDKIVLMFTYVTGTYIDSFGETQYIYSTPVKLHVGDTTTVSCYVPSMHIYRDLTINNIVASLVGDTFKLSYDVYVKLSPTDTRGWTAYNLHNPMVPTAQIQYLSYKLVTRRWVDVDQYSIIGLYYITNKSDIDYGDKRYVFCGIKAGPDTSIAVTKDYKNIALVNLKWISPFFANQSEQAARFPEFNPAFTTPRYEISIKPTKFGSLARGIYVGKTFTDSIKVCDFNADLQSYTYEQGKTYEMSYRGEYEWKVMNSTYQNIYYPHNYKPVYVFWPAHVYEEVKTTDINVIDWSKDTYTSYRPYDNVVDNIPMIDTCGIFPEEKIGIGSIYQWYTNNVPYNIQIPMSPSYFSTSPVETPIYHGESYTSTVVLQNYIYEDGTKRIMNSKKLDSLPTKKSTPNMSATSLDYGTTQSSLELVARKVEVIAYERSSPGQAIKFEISPDYTFYGISTSFNNLRARVPVKGGTTYMLEDINKQKAADISTLQTVDGPVDTTTITEAAYPCGYSY